MPVCSACGQGNPDRARFCMACGSPLPGDEPAPHGARKTVTVVFCDVAGSTPIAERLDPESVREVLSRFFREMRAVLEAHGGTVEKFIGDAVMAVFGVPLLHEDDAIRAVRAAAEMRDALPALSENIVGRWGVELRARIGVNTGEVVVGDPEAGQALVVGDAVNVAARLEQAATPGEVLLGPATYALVRDLVEAEETGPLELKGKRAPALAFRLLGVEPGSLAAPRPEPPLVGRRDELATLRSAFERCAGDRRCELVTILGSAGEGKSRLAREFVGELAERALVLPARCLPYGDGITFWPVAELVKQACGITDDDPRDLALARIEATVDGAEDGSLIAERVAAVTGFGSATAGLQETFWAIRRFLEHVGRDLPLVVSVDDLQWAEPTFLDLVEYLAGWGRDVAMLLLCLARPDLMDARPSWGSGVANASTLPLSPLGDEESAELIAAILGGDRLDERTTARIAQAAGGNPLFLEEMLRMLEDDGLLQRQDGGWVATADLSDVDVPASIHALLGARLDRLAADERSVIRCASVIGKVFWWGAVAELVPASLRAEVGSHLQTLVRKELVRPERSSFAGEDAFRFHHILIQETAYRGTPKEIRADLHERFAVWVERAVGERASEFEEVLGYHLEQAYRYRIELGAAEDRTAELGLRGARLLAAAGRRAFARGDMSAAADLLGRGAALFPAEHPERRALLPNLGEALSEEGDLAGGEAVLAEAIDLARRADDRGGYANAEIVRLLVLEATDPKGRSQSLSQVEALIEVLEELGDDLGLARAHRLLGDIHWAHCHYAAADAAFERAIEYARRAGGGWEEAWLQGQYMGSGTYGPVPAAEVARRCEDVLARSEGVGGVEARALRALAAVRAMEGRFDEARELAARARSILEELGQRLRAAFVSETSGFIETLAGDFVAAERELRSGYDTMVELGERGFQATVAGELAHALLEQGRLGDAEVLAKVSEDVGAEDDIATQVLWRSARARILATRLRTPEAESLGREALALAEATDDLNMHADTLVDLGEVLRAAGRHTEAADAFSQAVDRYEAKGNVVGARDARRRLASVDASV
jgi:class 3 adenylate cyclase/tetratricopeptide (TPR) repeat protein